MRALLLSNSANYGTEPLVHAIASIRLLLADVDRLVFVPYALHDHDAYTQSIATALAEVCEVVGAHKLDQSELKKAKAYFVGGGNTFRLLHRLQSDGTLELLRDQVTQGVPYMGASAGTAICGPTIRTTNDMPIVEPKSLAALGLVSFHLNCHYPDPEMGPRKFMGETRDERIAEFLEENDSKVICLREGAWIDITGTTATIGGTRGGRLFERGCAPISLSNGDILSLTGELS